MDKTIGEQLRLKSKDYPFEIRNKSDKIIYHENDNNEWALNSYDFMGNTIYFENHKGTFEIRKFDQNGKEVYYEDNSGFWKKSKFNNNGKQIYFETSERGVVIDELASEEFVYLSSKEIAAKFGLDESRLKIIFE